MTHPMVVGDGGSGPGERARLGVVLLSIGAALAAPISIEARPLTLRHAERAIDLAWEAELAGDAAGARTALEALSRTSTVPASLPARARIETWLRGERARASAVGHLGLASRPLAYRLAFESLREFGEARSERLWSRALDDIPSLAATVTATTTVEITIERVEGPVDVERLRDTLISLLARKGVVALSTPGLARIQVRLDLDAKEATTRGPHVLVTAAATAVLRDNKDRRAVIATFSRRHAEARKTEELARRAALRRLEQEIAWAVASSVRSRALELCAGGTSPAFDSHRGLGSN